MSSKSLHQAQGKYEGSKECFLDKVTRWGWCWHFCIKEMATGDRKKLMWELEKTEMYSSCMMSRARCNEDNRKWQSSKWCAASFWADRSSGCICQGQLKGHCSSQDTRHQAETTNLGLQSSRKHALKGSSEGVQQGLDIAGGTVSSSPKLCLVTSRLLQ